MDLSKLKPKTLIIKTARAKNGIAQLLLTIKKTNSNSSFVQIFDPGSIVDRTHLIGAYANALFAFDDKTNKTEGMAMEMLLFAAMTDQIGAALLRVGAKDDNSKIVVFCNNRAAYQKAKKYMEDISEFRPSPAHIKKTAARLKIKPRKGENVDALILERIATSRLYSG